MQKSGEPVVDSALKAGFWDLPRKTFEEAWAFNARKIALQKMMLDAWQKANVDVVLGPAGPHTAVKPGEWTNYSYTVAWNAVDVSTFSPFSSLTGLDSQNHTVSGRDRALHDCRPRKRS